MSIALSSIIPKDIFTTIPVIMEINGETIVDKITILSPTIERMEDFAELSKGSDSNEHILFCLIKTFTDINVDIENSDALKNSLNYFGEIFDALQYEMYRILTVIIKQGFKTREMIASMDDEFFDKLKDSGIKEIDDLISLKKSIK